MPDVIIKVPKFHAKQQIAFDSKANEILFGGATRGGKSFFVRRAYILWCSQIPGLQCDIFRLHLDDIIGNHMEGETSFPVLLSEWERAGLCKVNQTEIKFWNGSQISLEHASDEASVMSKHQGIAKHVRTFEEATQISSRLIQWLTGWVTMSEEMQSRVPEKWKGMFPRIYYTTNPIGKSAGYFRREFVKARPPYAIEKVGFFNRQYIPALVEDNPSENAEATRARVGNLGDQAVSDALLNANWDALAGDFYPEWSDERHVVEDFSPPAHWFRFRSFDWGTAEPFAVYWWAVSDGEPFRDLNNKQRWYPRGALIAYQEWYGCDDKDPAKGCRMRNEDIAQGILARSEYDFRNVITLTDSLPFQDRGGETIAQTFQKQGVILTQGDTSRVPGWSQLRSRLIGIEIDSNDGRRVPMIYFCDSCRYAREYIPALTRHASESKKEDAVEHGEATHTCDAIRLACMAHSVIKDRKEPTETLIKRALQQSKPTMKRLAASAGIKL